MTESRAKPTVIVVERDTHICELLSHFLAEAKLSVECLTDGYGALDRIRLERPAIVITDILIPALDGLSLCRLIKSDESLRGTKVIVLTILSAEERAMQSGADAFMKKPIEKNSLLETVRALMEQPEGYQA